MKIFTLIVLVFFTSCSVEQTKVPPPTPTPIPQVLTSDINLSEPPLEKDKIEVPQNTPQTKDVVEKNTPKTKDVEKKKVKNYQTSFSIEEDIKNSVEISEYVFDQIIQADKDSYGNDVQQKYLKDTSSAGYINLNNDKKPDLILIGDPGANIGGFWIFRNVENRWQLMFETRTYSLEILKTKTNGYYNINIAAMSAITLWESVYKFNGEKYLAKDCYESDLSQSKQVMEYFQCPGSTEKPYR